MLYNITMRKAVNIITIVVLVVALAALVYGFVSSHYKVYDKPDARDNGRCSTFTTMNQSQLLKEMCYDAIIIDAEGNLINKGREAACLT